MSTLTARFSVTSRVSPQSVHYDPPPREDFFHTSLAKLGCRFSREGFSLESLPVEMLNGAVIIPNLLARKVRAEMKISLLAGPIIGHISRPEWIFLTNAFGQSSQIPQELRELNVKLVPENRFTLFSFTEESHDSWHWVQPPTPGSPLPPQSALVGVSRRIAYRDRESIIVGW